MRNVKAYSQKARLSNLKELNEMANYLKANEIYTIEDLEARVSTLRDTVDGLKATMDKETARMKEIQKLHEYFATYKALKPIADELQKIKFTKAKEKYKAEHAAELRQFYAARRKILDGFPDHKFDSRVLDKEYAQLEQQHKDTYAKFVAIRDEQQRIWDIQYRVNKGRGNVQHQKQKSQEQEI